MKIKIQIPECMMNRSMKALRRLQEAETPARDIRSEMRVIMKKRRSTCSTCGGYAIGIICVDGCGRR